MKRGVMVPMALLAAVVTAVQVVATAAGKEYYLTQIIMSVYYAIVVLALCLVMGYAGQISLGQAAFFAIGGYTSAVLTTLDMAAAGEALWSRCLMRIGALALRPDLYGRQILTVAPWAAFLAAMGLTATVALLIGYPALRLKGHYLAMGTLGFGLIVYRVVLGSAVTGSADGIHGVPPWPLAPGITICGQTACRVQNYYVAWAFALTVLFLLLNLVDSRVGRALRAIHGGETAANTMGINTARYKLQAFVTSALLTAAAGCCFTHYTGGIGPSEADAIKSVRYVTLVAAGGMANLWGALSVSTLLNFLSLRGRFGTLDHFVFGAILIGIISFAPEGPLRPLAEWWQRRKRRVQRRPAAAAAAAPKETPS